MFANLAYWIDWVSNHAIAITFVGGLLLLQLHWFTLPGRDADR